MQRLAVGIAVELVARAGLHVGVGAFAVAPQRLLAVHHRPAQAAHLVVGVERREVVAVAAAELRVLLEQALLHVEAEGLRLGVLVAGLHVGSGNLSTWPLRNSTSYSVLPRYSGFFAISSAGHTSSILKRLENSISCHRSERASPGAVDELVPEVRAPLGVAVGAFLLDPHRRRQDQVGRHAR